MIRTLARVASIDDPTKNWRVKVRLPGLDSSMPEEALPWLAATTMAFNAGHLPQPDDWVEVWWDTPAMQSGVWMPWSIREQSLVDFLGSDEDYQLAHVLTWDQRSKGRELILLWSPSQGWLLRQDDCQINIRQDDTLFLTNGKRSVHFKDSHLSLGSEDKSAEPAVLGDQNEEALTKLRDLVDELAKIVSQTWQQLATTASAIPHTAPMSPVFLAGKAQVDAKMAALLAAIDQHRPQTKSKVLSVD